MSFILDALRRAEAQRERGQVPGLHSQSVASAAPAETTAGARSSAVWLLGGLCALLIVALGALWWSRGADPAPVPAPAPAVAHAPPVAAPVAAPASASVSTPSASPLPAVVIPPAPAAAAKPSATAASAAAALPAPRPTASKAATSAARRPAKAAASAAAPPASTVVPPLLTPAELPEPWRGAVARLGISGAVHSSDPTQSFVMVSGQLAREGDRVAPEVTIERIGPRATVLRAGPHRVEIRY